MSPKHLILAVGVLFLAVTVVSCGSPAGTSSGAIPAPVVANRSGVLLISVRAVNFARNAAAGTTPGGPLISREQADAALARASQMLRELEVKHPDIEQDNPTPAYVLERPDEHFVVKPVVLGLTDGTLQPHFLSPAIQSVKPGEKAEHFFFSM